MGTVIYLSDRRNKVEMVDVGEVARMEPENFLDQIEWAHLCLVKKPGYAMKVVCELDEKCPYCKKQYSRREVMFWKK